MSNRFHSKYHRKNHHTYGNASNPEASHDPIASPDQPFLGDFSLQGALCAVAPLSAYAGYFYSSKTGIRTIGGEIGISAYSLNTPLSTAFGKNIMHGTVGINKNTITSGYVLDVLGNTNLDGNLNVVGDVDIDGGDLTASTATFNLLNTSPVATINFGGNAAIVNIGNDTTSTVNINGNTDSTSCSTGALVVDGGVGIGGNLNICGQLEINNTTESTSCTTGALVVDGGVGIAKNLNVCGNAIIAGDLTVNGTTTYLNTEVEITSAVEIVNVGTGPALKVTQAGSQPIAHFIDSNGDDIVFNDNGYVGIGTMNPNEKLTVIGNISAFGNHVFESNSTSAALRITQNGTGNALVVEDSTNPDSTPFMVGNDGRVYIGSTQTAFTGNLIIERPFQAASQVASIYNRGRFNSSNTTSVVGIQNVVLAETGNYTVPSVASFLAEGSNILNQGVSATYVYGYIADKSLSNTGLNNIGFYSNLSASGFSNYNIYSAGEAPNYFNGKVGIGETTPEGLLHVKSGTSGSVTAPASSVGIFESDSNCYISLLSPNSKYTGVVMGGPTNPYGSYLSWNHDNLDLKLGTNHANADIQFLVSTEQEAMRINPSGNVGIGTTTPTEKLTVSGRVSATGYRANQGIPSGGNSSTNGYAFLSDGDTGLFSPIDTGGQNNGVVSLFSNGSEQLRASGGSVKIYGSLETLGNLYIGGTIVNDPNTPITTTVDYNVTQTDHDKTILANHATNTININLPSGLKSGTQVSVIRVGAGTVQFAKGTGLPGLSSTPTNDFKKLGFQNSAASAYWTGTTWYLVGDLLS